jgi:hypothetical protein
MRGIIAAIALAALATISALAASNPAHAQARSRVETPAENVGRASGTTTFSVQTVASGLTAHVRSAIRSSMIANYGTTASGRLMNMSRSGLEVSGDGIEAFQMRSGLPRGSVTAGRSMPRRFFR